MRKLPNAITLLNVFLGSAAMVLVMEGQPVSASLLVGICAILDFLDGAVARALKAWSPLGSQLDSLADLVSFGVAPAAIVYHYMQQAIEAGSPGLSPIAWPLAAFLIAVFSALRLARFNIDTQQEDDFIGLPTPAAALLIASFPLVLEAAPATGPVYRAIVWLTESYPASLAFVAVISWLLVSPICMFSLKVKSWQWKENRIRLIFLAGCLLLLITFGVPALPLFLIFYIILSLADHLISKRP